MLMNQTLANAAAIGGSILTVIFLVPQIVKLIRTGDSAGVLRDDPQKTRHHRRL